MSNTNTSVHIEAVEFGYKTAWGSLFNVLVDNIILDDPNAMNKFRKGVGAVKEAYRIAIKEAGD